MTEISAAQLVSVVGPQTILKQNANAIIFSALKNGSSASILFLGTRPNPFEQLISSCEQDHGFQELLSFQIFPRKKR